MNTKLLRKIVSLFLIFTCIYSCKLFDNKLYWDTGNYYSLFYDKTYYLDFDRNIFIYIKKQLHRSARSKNMEISEGRLLFLSENTYLLESKERVDIDNPYVDYVLLNDTLVLERKYGIIKTQKGDTVEIKKSVDFVDPYRGLGIKNTYNIIFKKPDAFGNDQNDPNYGHDR